MVVPLTVVGGHTIKTTCKLYKQLTAQQLCLIVQLEIRIPTYVLMTPHGFMSLQVNTRINK